MSSDLHFEHESGCLIVRTPGRYVVEHREEAVKSIAKAAKERPTRAVLIDMRGIQGPLKFSDRYQLGEMGGRYLNFLPVACLVLPEHTDPGRIGQLVANNRGANVERFTDETDARAWLKQYQAAEPRTATK